MASIYDTILREDPLTQARREAEARLEAERTKQEQLFQQSLAGLDPAVRGGAQSGRAVGQLLQALGVKGGRLTGTQPETVDTSREVQEVRRRQELIKDLQGIEAARGTSKWYTEAAAQAKARGDEGLAFQLLGTAAEARKAEAKLEREAEEKDRADWRSTVNTLPSAQKFSLIVNDPETAKRMFGLKGKEGDAFVQDARDNLATVRAKNLSELNKIKPVNPANVTKGDIAAVSATLDTIGYDADAFNPGFGENETAREQFLSILADQARTEQEIRARRGGETLSLDQITSEIMGDLEEQQVFVRKPDRFGSGFTLTDDFNADNVRNVFKTRLNEFQGSKPAPATQAAPAAEAAPSGPEVPFVDFTQPPR